MNKHVQHLRMVICRFRITDCLIPFTVGYWLSISSEAYRPIPIRRSSVAVFLYLTRCNVQRETEARVAVERRRSPPFDVALQ